MNITIEQLLIELAQNELSNLASITEAGETTSIRQADRAGVVTAINDGLTEIHTRLVLRRDSVLIECIPGLHEYNLDRIHARSYQGADQSEHKYIVDTPEKPFVGNVIKILSIVGSATGEKSINSNDNWHTEMTSPTSFRIHGRLDSAILVKFQAQHPKLEEDCRSLVIQGEDTKEEDFVGFTGSIGNTNILNIPSFILPMLKNYVAYRIYSKIQTQEASYIGNRYYALYQEALNNAAINNTANDSELNTEKHLFYIRGWV